MNETQIQAALRFVRVIVVAAIGAGVANVTILKDVVTDPVFGTAVTAIVLAILEALAKLAGGATAPVEARAVGFTGSGGPAERRPNILAV